MLVDMPKFLNIIAFEFENFWKYENENWISTKKENISMLDARSFSQKHRITCSAK